MLPRLGITAQPGILILVMEWAGISMEPIAVEPISPWVDFLLKAYAQWPWVGLLLLMMILDTGSGIVAAIYERRLSSKIGYRGMMKKTGTLIVVGVCYLIERAILVTLPPDLQTGITIPLAKLSAGFFLFNEAISVLENCKRAGVPLPAFLTKSLVETINKMSNYGFGDKRPDETVELRLKDAKVEATIHHPPTPDAPTIPLAVKVLPAGDASIRP